jgi:hypothetical protein
VVREGNGPVLACGQVEKSSGGLVVRWEIGLVGKWSGGLVIRWGSGQVG